MDARKTSFAPNTPDSLCANYTRHLMCFARMVPFKDPLTLDIGYPSSLGFSFEIEIQTHARKTELERIC